MAQTSAWMSPRARRFTRIAIPFSASESCRLSAPVNGAASSDPAMLKSPSLIGACSAVSSTELKLRVPDTGALDGATCAMPGRVTPV